MIKIQGAIQHYDWGGKNFIPSLLNINNNDNKPFAEYWLGTHPKASATFNNINLADEISENKAAYLGDDITKQYNELPFLLKILDVKQTLSIQVHPSKTEAEKGFAAEDRAGIELNASNRNYKDKNHKPEMMVALSKFYLLHGFKNEAALLQVFEVNPELNICKDIFENEGYKGLYSFVMNMPQSDVNKILLPLLEKELVKKRLENLTENNEGWWFIKWYEEAGRPENIDRGVFSVYFFNIVELQPGEGIYQGAGLPHAYLQGQNVELMANSDNVLRGGLTTKHIDVAELLKHTLFEAITPEILAKAHIENVEKFYASKADEFALSVIELEEGEAYDHTTTSPEIIICLSGEVFTNDEQVLKKGEAIFIKYNESYRLKANINTVLYKAFVNKK